MKFPPITTKTTYNVFFTKNNYTKEQYDSILDWIGRESTYYVLGKEIGKECGTPHLHGFAEFTNGRRWTRLHKVLFNAHMRPRWGSVQEASDYCKKDGDYVEDGTPSQQGKRNDIHAVREILDDPAHRNRPMREVVRQATSMQSVRLAETFLRYHERKRTWQPAVAWYYGPTGSGKTRDAFENTKDPFIWSVCKWWDGYDAHEHVIIDDFRKDFCSFHKLLRILDRYPETVETKGGSRQLLATKIIITAPHPPHVLFEGCSENIVQLYRRLSGLWRFNADGSKKAMPLKHIICHFENIPITPRLQKTKNSYEDSRW